VLSAALATQASTLWNFAGTEWWVFGKREAGRSFWQRLVSFLAMNNGMLLLRAPILALLVSRLGMNYILANLISLFAMTILRYLVADKLIWNKSNQQRGKENRYELVKAKRKNPGESI
jgi:putative flippase GtrA